MASCSTSQGRRSGLEGMISRRATFGGRIGDDDPLRCSLRGNIALSAFSPSSLSRPGSAAGVGVRRWFVSRVVRGTGTSSLRLLK